MCVAASEPGSSYSLVAPDGYGVLALPDRPPIHLLLELDRGTEAATRLHEKAVRYARALPRSTLRDLQPIIVLTTPTPARAETAAAAVAETAAPITVAVWSPASPRPVLTIVTAAAVRVPNAKPIFTPDSRPPP